MEISVSDLKPLTDEIKEILKMAIDKKWEIMVCPDYEKTENYTCIIINKIPKE